LTHCRPFQVTFTASNISANWLTMFIQLDESGLDSGFHDHLAKVVTIARAPGTTLGSGRPLTGGPIVRSGAHDPGLFYSPRQGCAAVATIAIAPRTPMPGIVITRWLAWFERCCILIRLSIAPMTHFILACMGA
jgi:hypothetical protein